MKKRMAVAGMGMLALMVSGVMFTNSAVLADEMSPSWSGDHHLDRGHGHHSDEPLSEEHREHMRAYFRELSPELSRHMHMHDAEHQNHAPALSEFLGLTPEELQARRDSGERPRDILEDQGKTHEELVEFLMQHRDSYLETYSN